MSNCLIGDIIPASRKAKPETLLGWEFDMRRSLFSVLIVALLSSAAWAQFEMGSIVGLIVDPSGGPIPGASVDIRSTNLGLRDDILTAWHERHNRLEGFVPTNGGTFVLVGNPPFQNGVVTQSNWHDLGPRFGFAYNVASKTVIRGGYGIYYSFQSNTSNDNQAKNPPYNGNVIVTNSSNDYADALPISAGFSAARPSLYPITNQQFIYWPYNYQDPGIQEWNLNVQRQLPSNLVLSVAYVGTKGSHIDVFDNCNAAPPGPGAVGPRRPFPNLSDCVTVTPWGNSSYNSLQASVERRMAGGLTMLASYSYAHSIDDSSGQESETVQNPYDLALNRGNSTFDVRQSLVLSWTYEVPIGKNLHGPAAILAKGWTLNSIDSFINGSPFTPTMQTDALNNGSGVQWPNRIAAGTIPNPSVNMWFNPAAFVRRAPTTMATKAGTSCTGREPARSTCRRSRTSPSARKAAGCNSGARCSIS